MFLDLDHCVVDLKAGRIITPDGEGSLSPTERRVLALLADTRGATVSRDVLLHKVWNRTDDQSRVVDVVIRSLRTKLETDPKNPRWLRSVYGEGYMLELEPEAAMAPTASAPTPPICLPDGRIDLETATVWRGDGSSPLTAQEVKVLRVLSKQIGEFVEREDVERRVWGPGGQGRALDHVIRRLRNKLEVDPNDPQLIRTRRGLGPGLFTTTAGRLHHAPSRCETLFGRDSLVQQVVDGLSQNRWVTLLGPGGIGKTQVALAAAHALADQGLVGFWVSMAGCEGPEALVDRIAHTHQATPNTSTRAGVEALLQRPGGCLLVLDNVEEAAANIAPLLMDLLDTTPCRLLLTSRVLVQSTKETIVEVGPLASEAADALMTDQCSRMGTPVEPATISQIATELGYSPLAIEIAAGQLRHLPVSELILAMQQPLDIQSPRHGGRHRSLRTVMDLSWSLLATDEQDALAALSVFRGSFTSHAAQAVAGTTQWMRALHDAGLIHREGERWRLMPPVRQFAAEHLNDDRPERAHLASYAGTIPQDVNEAITKFGDTDELLALHDNVNELIQGCETGIRLNLPTETARVLAGLGHLARDTGNHRFFFEGLERIPPGGPAILKQHLGLLQATLLGLKDDHRDSSNGIIEEQLACDLPDNTRQRFAYRQAINQLYAGNPMQALEGVGLIAEGATDPLVLRDALMTTALLDPDPDKRRVAAQRARRLPIAGSFSRAVLMGKHGLFCMSDGQLQRAKWSLEEAVEGMQPFPFRHAMALRPLGVCLLTLGETRAAIACLERSQAIMAEVSPAQANPGGYLMWARWIDTDQGPQGQDLRHIQRHVAEPDPGFLVGVLLALLERPREAAAMLSMEQRHETLHLVAQALIHAGQGTSEAAALCQRAASLVPLLDNAPLQAWATAIVGVAHHRLGLPNAASLLNQAGAAADHMMMSTQSLVRATIAFAEDP